jgi:iron only hydrogenase large subunit-like protein
LKNINGGNICTACPAVISYVEKHKPELKRIIMPVTSPMVSHGRMLKERLGSDWIVVFIGPCAAKRMESQRTENKGAVDFVLTFSELIQWIADEGVDMGQCGESDFESHVSLNEARLFPLRGGLYKNNDGEKNRGQALHVTGPIDVLRILNQDPDKWEHKVIEPLFCSDGCINGSGFPADKSLFDRRKDLICYARNRAQKV